MTVCPVLVRRGAKEDVPAMQELERLCFAEARRDSVRAMYLSIRSPHQEVWVAERAGRLAGFLTIRIHPRSLRVYSIAVHPDSAGTGIGSRLMHWAAERARAHRRERLSLEADTSQPKLCAWYARLGYIARRKLRHYYGRGLHAQRMVLTLQPDSTKP